MTMHIGDLAMPEGASACECSHCDGGYPMYGVAPHECYWRKGPEFTIGQSTLLSVDQWEAGFVPDLNENEGWTDFRYPSASGVFYCPNCQQDRYRAAWDALVERIGPPPADVGAAA